VKTTHFAIKAYAVALLTLMLGVLLSVWLDDWLWLSRSGSLVVINGIVLTSHQIIDHINRLKLSQMRPPRQFERDWADSDKRHLIDDVAGGVWRYEKYGLYMLIVGTLVWGFGDLLNAF
jgi:hypothetical protein